MTKRRRRRLKYKIGGRTVVYVSNSSSGAVVGLPSENDSSGLHLTITKETGTAGKHLTYHQGETTFHVPLGKLSPEQIEWLKRFVDGHTVPIRLGQPVWTPTEDFIRKLGGLPPNINIDVARVLAPTLLPELVDPDLDDPSKWTQTSIGEFAESGGLIGIARIGGQPVLLYPWRQERMIQLPVKDLIGMAASLLDITGLLELMNLVRKRP